MTIKYIKSAEKRGLIIDYGDIQTPRFFAFTIENGGVWFDTLRAAEKFMRKCGYKIDQQAADVRRCAEFHAQVKDWDDCHFCYDCSGIY